MPDSMDDSQYHLVEDRPWKFYQELHRMLLERLFIREPHMKAYRDLLQPVCRNARDENKSMVINGPAREEWLYLNIEMSMTMPIVGIAPGIFFRPRGSLGRGKVAVEDRHQVEPDFRAKSIRKLMGR